MEEEIEDMVLNHHEDLSLDEADSISKRLYGRLKGDLGPLSYLLNDKEITEIMVNGPKEVFIEKKGHLIKVEDSFDDEEDLNLVIRRIAASVHREINELNPILDARLPDGSRVNAIMNNVAIGGPSLTIRRFSNPCIPFASRVLMVNPIVMFSNAHMQRRPITSAKIQDRSPANEVGGTIPHPLGSKNATIIIGMPLIRLPISFCAEILI